MQLRGYLRTTLAVFLLGASGSPAGAQGWADSLALDPPTWDLGPAELRLGGFASGSAYTAISGGGTDESGVTGQLRANLRLQRTLDTGLTLGARSTILVFHDDLSGDAYGNDTFEKAYLYATTGLGSVELGQQVGVGDTLGLTGPKVDDHVSLDNPDTTFFRDAATNGRYDSFFRPYTVVNDSGVDAKLNYLSPRLFGIQVGGSFTPHLVKAPLPFLGNPSDAPDRQANVWEVAGSYSGYFGDLAAGLSGAFAHGSLENATPGFESLYDFALGVQFAYSLDAVKLSGGGGYRTTNAYALMPASVYSGGETHLVHVSAMIETGAWRLGGEYSNGDVKGPTGVSDYGLDAYQLAAGYRVNDNLQLTLGWQWQNYARSLGTFSNSAKSVDMNAGFLTFGYTL